MGKGLKEGEITGEDLKELFKEKATEAMIGGILHVKDNYYIMEPGYTTTKGEAYDLGYNSGRAIVELATIGMTARELTIATRNLAIKLGRIKSVSVEGAVKTWTSPDKYVGETATAIEAKYPGKVVDVNQIKYRPDGTILTDFDIELNNTVIQVKAGTAKGLTTQITKTAAGTSKEVIGYAPDLNPSSALVKNANKQGIKVFTSLDDLLNYFSK